MTIISSGSKEIHLTNWSPNLHINETLEKTKEERESGGVTIFLSLKNLSTLYKAYLWEIGCLPLSSGKRYKYHSVSWFIEVWGPGQCSMERKRIKQVEITELNCSA